MQSSEAIFQVGNNRFFSATEAFCQAIRSLYFFSSTLFVLLNNVHESEMDVNLFEKNIQLGKGSIGNLADVGIRKTYQLNSHEKYPIN